MTLANALNAIGLSPLIYYRPKETIAQGKFRPKENFERGTSAQKTPPLAKAKRRGRNREEADVVFGGNQAAFKPVFVPTYDSFDDTRFGSKVQ